MNDPQMIAKAKNILRNTKYKVEAIFNDDTLLVSYPECYTSVDYLPQRNVEYKISKTPSGLYIDGEFAECPQYAVRITTELLITIELARLGYHMDLVFSYDNNKQEIDKPFAHMLYSMPITKKNEYMEGYLVDLIAKEVNGCSQDEIDAIINHKKIRKGYDVVKRVLSVFSPKESKK